VALAERCRAGDMWGRLDVSDALASEMARLRAKSF
jgi:hypothetical protein